MVNRATFATSVILLLAVDDVEPPVTVKRSLGSIMHHPLSGGEFHPFPKVSAPIVRWSGLYWSNMDISLDDIIGGDHGSRGETSKSSKRFSMCDEYLRLNDRGTFRIQN